MNCLIQGWFGRDKGGGGSEKRKREKGAVTVCHTGATKGNFKRGGGGSEKRKREK
jgi:hypothetical protein